MSKPIRNFGHGGGAICDGDKPTFKPGATPVGFGLPLSRFTRFREAVDACTGAACAASGTKAKTLFAELRAEALKAPAGELIGPLRLRAVEELYDELFSKKRR